VIEPLSRSERVLRLCEETREHLGPGEAGDRIEAIGTRLREPLRLGVAGRVKTGKSTLVNALLGRRIAPTDVSECTKVVTWFRYGFPETIQVIPREGSARRLAFDGGELPRELGQPPETVDRLVVTLSNQALRRLTIVDTPGLASAKDEISAQTRELLAMTDASRRAASQVDALVFVVTQAAREDDAEALEAFGQMLGATDSSPATAVGVLGMADKIARGDPAQAEAIAEGFCGVLHGRVATVIPMVALAAETALCGVLTEQDARALEALAVEQPRRRDALFSSVDLFRKLAPLPPDQADRLLTLLDLYGIHRAIGLVISGITGAGPLSGELAALSGINGLRAVLDELFERQADTLKARTALADLEELSWQDVHGTEGLELRRLRDRVEELRLQPEMHRIREILALRRCGSDVALPSELQLDAVRVMTDGTPAAKLGLPPTASRRELEEAALAGANRWTAFKNDATVDQAEIAEVLCRSYALIWDEVGGQRRAAAG
jgi:hypothetical protein